MSSIFCDSQIQALSYCTIFFSAFLLVLLFKEALSRSCICDGGAKPTWFNNILLALTMRTSEGLNLLINNFQAEKVIRRSHYEIRCLSLLDLNMTQADNDRRLQYHMVVLVYRSQRTSSLPPVTGKTSLFQEMCLSHT